VVPRATRGPGKPVAPESALCPGPTQMNNTVHDWRRAWSCRKANRRSAGRQLCLILVLLLLLAFPAFVKANTVGLAWDPNTESGVGGYLVFYGTQSGNYSGYVDVGLATNALMNTGSSTTSYYFAVAAYSTAGIRSALSAEVEWSPGAPLLTNPGSQTSTIGQNVALGLSATDPAGLAITYGASGLPPGLSIAPATGVIAGTPSAAGAWNVSAVATNTAGAAATQLFTWSVLAQPAGTPTIGTGDSAPPTISISSPSNNNTYAINATTISLAGTVSDNVGVVSVTWTNDRGGRGPATFGTSSWSVSSIDLKNGSNLLTVTAADAAGNTASTTLTVTSKVTGKK
jgi:hypothetical protein